MITIATATEYTESSRKDCINQSCYLSLFQGQRFGIENNTWEPIENMASLKNTSIKCSVDFDGTFIVDCIDYNFTSRTLRLNLSNLNTADFNKQNISNILRVYSINKSKQELKQTISNLNFTLSNKVITIVIPAGMSDIIHFGENSTTIFLNSTNNGILGDAVADQTTPDTNKGTETQIAVQSYSNANSYGYLSINTSSIVSVCPSGSTIDFAEIVMQYTYSTDATRRIILYNTSAFNEGTITWNNQPNKTGNPIYNTTGGTGWKYYNATALFQGNYLNGVVYGVLYDVPIDNGAQKDNEFFSKEYATASDRWWINVSCTLGGETLNITNPTASVPITVSSGDVDTLEFLFGNYFDRVKILNITINTTNVVPLNTMKECVGTSSSCSAFSTSDTCGKAGCNSWTAPITSYSAENLTKDNTSGTGYIQTLRLNWTAESGSAYLIFGSIDFNRTLGAIDSNVRVEKNSVEQFLFLERTATAGSRYTASFMQIAVGVGSQVIYNWSFANSGAQANNNTEVMNRRLYAIRIDNIPNAQWNYSFDGTGATNVNNVWGDVATDNENFIITPSTSGRYLVYGVAGVTSGSTSSSWSMRLNVSGNSQSVIYPILGGGGEGVLSYLRQEDRATTDYTSQSIMKVLNFTGGQTYNVSLQFIDIDTTASADWRDISVLAVRLDNVFNFIYRNNTINTTTASTVFQNKSIIYTDNATGNYISLMSMASRLDQTGYDYEYQFANSNIFGLGIERPKDVNDTIGKTSFGNITLPNLNLTFTNQFRRQDATGTVMAKNSEILLLSIPTTGTCSGTANPCYFYNSVTCDVNDTSCDYNSSTQMWNGSRWIANVTMPTMGNGTVDLFMKVNATSDGTISNDTEIGAIIYGGGIPPPSNSCTWSGTGTHLIQCSDYCNLTFTNYARNNIFINGSNSGMVTGYRNITNTTEIGIKGCVVWA